MITLNKILVPLDFSVPSRKALDYGAALARKFGARLVLAHIVPTIASLDYVFPDDTFDVEQRAYDDAKTCMSDLLTADYLADLDTQTIVKTGNVRRELLAIVDEED